MKNRKYIILLALSLFIIIGYSVLTSNIDIEGATKIKANSWDIHFENVVLNSGNVELDETDREASITDNNNTQVTYTVTLKKPGDFYEFTVDAKNDGTIDGMVNLTTSMIKYGDNDPIVITSNNLPSYLKYSVTYNNGSPIEKYHELKAGALETYKVRVEFDKELNNNDLPEDDVDLSFTFDVEYIQSGEEAVSTGINYQVIHQYQNLDNTYEEITENIKGEANSDITPSFRPKKGFDNPEAQTVNIKEDGSTKVTYVYPRHKYQLTLEDNEYIETTTPSGEYPYETTITLTRKDKENYSFVKWNTGETTDEISFKIDKDITIKPIYRSNYVTVTYNPNGGTVDPSSKTIGRYTNVGELATPLKTGFIFRGWYTGISDGERVANDYIVNDDIEIFARWMEENNCTYEGSLVQGAEYVNGQYTYRYKQQRTNGSTPWANISDDGWGVTLTDPTSTDPINTRLCTSINNKPIISMSNMFLNSQSSVIDTSSFDTSNVINMTAMFYNATKVESVDLSHFDTSNVTSMQAMFYGTSKLTSANLDNWNLRKIQSSTNGGSFFYNSTIKNLSAKNWKIPSSFNNWISRTWSSSTIETIDVTGWDLSQTTDINGLFGDSTKLKTITGLNTWNISNITNLSYLFQNCQLLTSLDLSKWNTSNVTTMYNMFTSTTSLTELNLDNWDLSKTNSVSNSSGFFGGSAIKKLSAKNWKLPAAFENWIARTWASNTIEEIDVTGWDLSLTTSINGLFGSAANLTKLTGVNTWKNTSNLTNISNVFQGCSKIKNIDLSNWNTSNVTNMNSMFNGTTSLEKLNLDNWDLRKLTSAESGGNFFYGSTINTLSAKNWKIPPTLNNWLTRIWGASTLVALDTTGWDLSQTTDISGLFADSTNLAAIKGLETWDTSSITNMSSLFANCSRLGMINLSSWNTSNVTNMNSMFNGCSKLTKIDLTNIDTSKVTDMQSMFADNTSLETIFASDSFVTTLLTEENSSKDMFINDAKLVGGAGTVFNENHIDKEYAHLDSGESNPGYFSLRGTIVVTLEPNGGIITNTKLYYNVGDKVGELPKPYQKEAMFDGWYTELTGGIKIDKNTIVNNNVAFYAHWRAPELVTITFISNGGNPAEITKEVYENDIIGELPKSYQDDYYLEGWYTGISDGVKITSNTIVEGETTYYGHWKHKRAILDTGTNVNVKMKNLANNSTSMYQSSDDNIIKAIKRSHELPNGFIPTTANTISSSENDYPIYMWFDSNSKTIYYYSDAETIYLNSNSNNLFRSMKKLETVELNDNIDTSLVSSMGYMFYNDSALTSIDLSHFNTSNVTDMGDMFRGCTYLETLDLSNFNTSKVTYMSGMFENCLNLTEVNLSNWDTSNVNSMSNLFYNCPKITTLDLSHFNTPKLKYMSSMFYGMSNLENLDISNFDTSEVTDMSYLFSGCSKLKDLDLSHFRTSKVTSMSNMFYNCSSLEILDITDFDTSNVTNTSYMFAFCSKLTELDVTSFDTSKVTNMNGMFSNMTNLKTIYGPTSFSRLASPTSSSMFYYDDRLVGGAGTTYSASRLNATYARIDGGTSTPGYFTGRKPIRVTFNPNGGTLLHKNRFYDIGETIGELPVPIYNEHLLIGWYTDIENGVEITSDYILESDIVLYARWRKLEKYDITFDKNDENATGSMEKQNVYETIPTPLNENQYSLEGYAFIGWNTEPDGTGASYLDGEDIVINGNTTLYAQWSKRYTLTFDKNDSNATGDTYTMSVISGVSTKIDNEAFSSYTLTGKKITSYNTESNYSGVDYYKSQNIIISQDTTLYAHWEDNTLFGYLKDLSETETCISKYNGAITDQVNTTVDATNVYLDKCSNKRNIIFNNMCWQVIRTTETGGTKMIYNGEVVDGKCESTRGTHKGATGDDVQFRGESLNSSYVYGDTFTYDPSDGTFTLLNTFTSTWSNSTYKELLGKYTCKNTSGTCTRLYNVNSYYSNTSAWITPYTVGDIHYSIIGNTPFNVNFTTPAMMGYMFNNTSTYNKKYLSRLEYVLNYEYLNVNYWYADSISWDSTTNKYSLVNPYKVNSESDYSTLNNKYTFYSSDENYTSSSVYYIAGYNGGQISYYMTLSNGHDLAYYNDRYTYGDTYTDNHDGTYTINSPNTLLVTDLYKNGNKLSNKYVCKNPTNNTCSDLWHVTTYWKTNDNCISYLTVNTVYKYANGFTYDENTNTYTLTDDSMTIWDIAESSNKENFNHRHYTCWNTSGTCSTISYIYYYGDSVRKFLPYFEMTGGDDINDALNEMLFADDVNKYNSSVKSFVDNWYSQNLISKTNMLEDAIYCNDRTIAKLGGWDPQGGDMLDNMIFKNSNYTGYNADLGCRTITDQFAVSNNKAKLTYPVGLLEAEEARRVGVANVITGDHFLLSSPQEFMSENASNEISYALLLTVGSDGLSRNGGGFSGVRPVISLKNTTVIYDGTGSETDPWIVENE